MPVSLGFSGPMGRTATQRAINAAKGQSGAYQGATDYTPAGPYVPTPAGGPTDYTPGAPPYNPLAGGPMGSAATQNAINAAKGQSGAYQGATDYTPAGPYVPTPAGGPTDYGGPGQSLSGGVVTQIPKQPYDPYGTPGGGGVVTQIPKQPYDPYGTPGGGGVVTPGGSYGQVAQGLQDQLNNGGLTYGNGPMDSTTVNPPWGGGTPGGWKPSPPPPNAMPGGYTPVGAPPPATTPLTVGRGGYGGATNAAGYAAQQAEAARRAAGPTAPRTTGYASLDGVQNTMAAGSPYLRPGARVGPQTPVTTGAVGGMTGGGPGMSGAGMRPLSPQQTVANQTAKRVRNRFTPMPGAATGY